MLIDRIPGHRVEGHKPAPRVTVSSETWHMLAGELAAGRVTLLGLWGDTDKVHMALLEEAEIVVVTVECPDGKFPSVGQAHPPAIRLERAIYDLYGLEPLGLPDRRPWLDHGRWGVKHPLGAQVEAHPVSVPYEFLPAEGEGLHQIAVGPVHAGIIEPGHFRFNVNGETVVRLEQRLGYVHKGIESLMAGRVARQGGAARRSRLGRQHRRLCARLRARRRGGARRGGAAARGRSARADGRAGARSPIISAISAPSATTPRSPSCMRNAACCASARCGQPTPASAIG